MSISQIQHRLESLLVYMEPYWDFVNCHMVNYLTHRHWERFVPAELRLEVQSPEATRDCIEQVFWQEDGAGSFPYFAKFMADSKKFRLDSFSELLTSTEQLCGRFSIAGLKSSISIKEFMTEKKVHEVETMAELVHQLVVQHEQQRPVSQPTILVDAGDGKGYLSSRLALQYSYRVVGLDCKESNTKNAIDRGRKLKRVWSGLVERAKANGDAPIAANAGRTVKPLHATKESYTIQNYATVAKFITPDLDVPQVIAEQWGAPLANDCTVCVVGLHTCGNLAPSCLRLFVKQPLCQLLCNIGCCYHLISERHTPPDRYLNAPPIDAEPGFPLSAFLNDKEAKLQRNARMLAAQSIERTVAAQELPNVSLYYRALLEILLATVHSDTIKIGKIKKIQSFTEYVQKSGFASTLQLSESELAQFELAHKDDSYFLDVFYLLRMSFAPVLESVILLDRLLYLKEQGHEDSHLVPLFDAVISPRRFAIVSVKH